MFSSRRFVVGGPHADAKPRSDEQPDSSPATAAATAVADAATAAAFARASKTCGASGLQLVLDLAERSAEPVLSHRLSLHIIWTSCEAVVLLVAVTLAQGQPRLVIVVTRLIELPLVLVFVKLVCAGNLAWGMWRLRNANDFTTAVQHLGVVQEQCIWAIVTSVFVSLSCLLAMWYAMLLLLAADLETGEEETPLLICYLELLSMVFGIGHFCLWLDFAKGCQDAGLDRDFSGDAYLHVLLNIYGSGVICVLHHSDLASKAETCCAVCLEDFSGRDAVAKLPCGHTFHPVCVNRWFLADSRCPFRCSLQLPPNLSRSTHSETSSSLIDFYLAALAEDPF
eukprot:TRINITY_DN35849_c0_g1_i1.p1 TRINITY_DN35849_c0_g1~~TRINITY_DN35849_c0_g1_i1.p1  ORF type:complete len:339 (-),score=50.04 TRINITY_DN35849_c0_g1_i1:268-1284(-)